MSTTRTCQDITFRLIFALLLLIAPLVSSEELPAPQPAQTEAANSNDTLRSYVELQAQIHAAQQRTEQIVRESIQAARAQVETQNAEALALQLGKLEERLSQQRTDEARFNFYVLSGFGVLGFLAVVITGYFQWRAVSRIAEFTAALPEKLRLATANPPTTVALRNALLNSEQVDLANSRLLGAVERLEKRILELEQAATPSLGAGRSREVTVPPVVVEDVSPEAEHPTAEQKTETAGIPDDQLSIPELLDRSQSLLNEDRAEEALLALDRVLTLEPEHADALVKKGAAFEKLRKLNEAIECYDRAIAADSSMTIAYLHKGGLFNRMERFGEAVECYEKALRTQEKRNAA